MNANARIESGKECSLADLFYSDNKVVIPDLQRDYCWGKDAWIEKEERFADLVSGFVKRLFNLYSETSGQGTQTLGLIYGFEQPKGHIQICDGQQRLTTLFLLLGYVNTKAEYVFSDYLMSQAERGDDYEPHLQYAIRESTLYFLSDLTKEVFIEGRSSLESVLKAYQRDPVQKFPDWYFREYDLDASIQNMLVALGSIDHVASEQSFNDWKGFGNYLLNNLQFLYYDMGTRSRGEETYVVINTTGEPLSPTENIKPIVIGRIDHVERKKKCSDEWENREDWFWKNRGDHKTSDINSYRFLVWYWQIGLLQERAWKDKVAYELSPRELFLAPPRPAKSEDTNDPNVESASMDRWEQFCNPETIHLYFKALKHLVKSVSQNDYLKKLFQSASFGLHGDAFDGTLADFFDKNQGGQKDWQLNMILPSIAYLVKYPKGNCLPGFIARLRKNFYDLRRTRNPEQIGNTNRSRTYVDWRHIIQLVEMSKKEEDVLVFDTMKNKDKFKRIPNVDVKEWHGSSERVIEDLNKIGIDVPTWIGHRTLMGDLTPLVFWKSNGNIDLYKTRFRWQNLRSLSIAVETYNSSSTKSKPIRLCAIANWYCLYRVLAGIVQIEHQPYTSWQMVGCRYSDCLDCLDGDFSYVSQSEFAEYADDPINLIPCCLTMLLKGDCLRLSDSMEPSKLIKAIIFAKTLVNEGSLIDRSNPYPICAYTESQNNKIDRALPMSWGNVILHYGYKRGVVPTKHRGKQYLDTSLTGEGRDEPLCIAKIKEVNCLITNEIQKLATTTGVTIPTLTT